VRLDGVLGEDGARGLLAFCSVVQLAVTLSFAVAASSKSLKSKSVPCTLCWVLMVRLGLSNSACVMVSMMLWRVFGERHIDAGGSLDLPDLAQQNIEHHAIDRVVGTIEQAGLDHGCHLAKPVDTAFPLLQPVGIPGQVVVQDGGELILEVDASLRQSVATRTRSFARPITSMRCLRNSSGNSLVMTCRSSLGNCLRSSGSRFSPTYLAVSM